MKKNISVIPLFLAAYLAGSAQNINGEKILVGRESITIINFPEKVLNINFSDDGAYDYYIPKRREEKSISLQFNKEQVTAPNTSLLVNEGGRSHMFRVVFDSTYNINDDSRPPLWYDHSNLKELKTFVQKQKELLAKGEDAESLSKMDKEQETQRKKDAEQRKAEAAKVQQQKETETAKKIKDAEKQRKEEEANQKEQTAALAKAKKDAEEKEKQLEQARQKDEQVKKAAEETSRKEAATLAQQQEAEEKKLKELRAKKDEEALAKAQAEAAEKKRLREEALAKKKAEEEEQQRIAAEAFAKKEAEKKAAQEKLAQLEAERKLKEAEKAYSEVGLWQRYGKKGIDVYNYPAGQMAMVNADFFIVADTLRNFRISDSLIRTDARDKLNIPASSVINSGVKMTLETIAFKDVHTYYKVKIENNTDEDFLLGKTYMYWYDEREQAKMIIKCSYLTYINFYPIIRPHTTQYIVFATRSPNVVKNESLVLFIDERRKEKGSASIVIPGKDYIHELAKVQTTVGNKTPANERADEAASKSTKKGKKKR